MKIVPLTVTNILAEYDKYKAQVNEAKSWSLDINDKTMYEVYMAEVRLNIKKVIGWAMWEWVSNKNINKLSSYNWYRQLIILEHMEKLNKIISEIKYTNPDSAIYKKQLEHNEPL